MQNKKSGRSKFFLNISLVALLAVTTASASIMMGCGCSNNSSEVSATPDSPVVETRVVAETQIVTEVVDVTGSGSENSEGSSGGSSSSGSGANNNNNSNSSAGSSSVNNSNSANNSNSSAGNNSAGSSANSSVNNSSSGGNNNSSSSNNTGGNSQSSAGGSSSGNNGNSSSVLKIDGKSFSVGDTVTCILSIKTPEFIENFQGQINYDTKYLECTKAKFLGEARGGSILNYKTNPGVIKFNGSSGVDGYDFTGGADMIEITYTVKAGGSTTPADKWDIARKLTEDGSGINYINSSGKPSNGMTSSLSYSK